MKRLAAGVSLVTLSLSLFVAARADAQKRPGRMPYDIFDRSRPSRRHVAPPPPIVPASVQPLTLRSATPLPVAVAPGVPTREFKLPQDRARRAPGYESAFDINVVSSLLALNRRDNLTPIPSPAGFAASSINRDSSTIYVISGCYLGNRPPSEASLPPGCDIKKAKTIK